MRTLSFAVLAIMITAMHSVAATPTEATLKVAAALSGKWHTRLQGNVDEILKFEGFTTQGYGTFSSTKMRGNQRLETISGYWRLHRNPLLPLTSRWQIQLVWRHSNWGEQKRSLAIRQLTQGKLTLGNVYLDNQNVAYRRIN